MIGRAAGDRVEGRVIVAFYRKRSGERLVPLTRTHRGTMAKLYEATCIVEVAFKLKEES
jgi:hypothetical protein